MLGFSLARLGVYAAILFGIVVAIASALEVAKERGRQEVRTEVAAQTARAVQEAVKQSQATAEAMAAKADADEAKLIEALHDLERYRDVSEGDIVVFDGKYARWLLGINDKRTTH